MTYLLIGITIISGGFLILKIFAKKSNTPENIITYFLQALAVEALEYAIENNWPKELSGDSLYKTLLVSSGYFFSLGKSFEVKLEYDEIVSLASYAIKLKPVEKTNVGGNNADERYIFFIVLYKLALGFKEKGNPVSFQEDSTFIREVNSFNDYNVRATVKRHMRDGSAPIGHQVLTKNLIKRYPKWFQMEFK
jgi:hypothetical protein